jgi:hypothetical protein
VVVNLAGYDDQGLAFDGSALLERPGFWAAYLGPILDADLDDELAELFAVPLGMIRGCYRRLTDTAGWPVLPIPLTLDGGAAVAVVFRNVEDEETIDFLLLPDGGAADGGAADGGAAAGGAPIRIAVAEGPVDGPGVSWAELTAIADRQPDPVRRAQTTLLLAAMLGDVDADTSRLADALRTVGAHAGAETIAARLVAAAPARWRRAPDGSLVCDHDGSTRNPGNRAALTGTDLRTVSALLLA